MNETRLTWMSCERRWREILVHAILPPLSDGSEPGLEIPDAYWRRALAAGSPLMRLGVRAAVWVLNWFPVLLWGYLRPFHRLNDHQRDELVRRWGGSRWYVVRQLIESLKVMACFAYFHHPAARDRAWRRAGLRADAGFCPPTAAHHPPVLKTQTFHND